MRWNGEHRRHRLCMVALVVAWALLAAACTPAVDRDPHVSATHRAIGVENVRILGASPEAIVPSPSGRQMLYTGWSGSTLVSYVVDLDSGQNTLVHAGPIAGADWTPDGQALVVSHWSPGARSMLADRISLFDLRDRSWRDITPSYRYLYGVPSVSPDGHRVIVTAADGDPMVDLAAALAGQRSNPTQFFAAEFFIGSSGFIRTFRDVLVTSPNAFHPSGDRFVGMYRSASSVSRSGVAEVDLISGDRTNRTPLLWSLRNVGYSPDGAYVIYSARYDDDPSHVFVLDRTGSGPIALTTGNTANRNPSWSADGYVYFFSDAGSVGNTRRITVWRLRPTL